MSESSELIQTSAEYVIKYAEQAPFSPWSYSWGGIAALSNSQVGIITAVTEGDCSNFDSV